MRVPAQSVVLLLSIGLPTTTATASAPRDGNDPLLRPLATERAARWLAPQPPTRVHGNTCLVGFGGLNVALVRTTAGIVLIDGALPQGVRQIREHLRRLGFELRDVKLILSTEPHYDHGGGPAALERDTGGTVVASSAAAEVLRAGRSGPDDPQAAWLIDFPPVQRVRAVRDGETVTLGDVTLTARATPGHTPGSMSWTWRSCELRGSGPRELEDERCANVVLASSLNPLAAEDYRYSAPANRALATAFRGTFATLRSLPCDLLLTAHPEHSGDDVKLARFRTAPEPNTFLDPAACRAYADRYERAFDEQLAQEAVAR